MSLKAGIAMQADFRPTGRAVVPEDRIGYSG